MTRTFKAITTSTALPELVHDLAARLPLRNRERPQRSRPRYTVVSYVPISRCVGI